MPRPRIHAPGEEPPKSEYVRRQRARDRAEGVKRVTARLSAEETARLEAIASRTGESASDVLRRALQELAE
jgi:hypothetical protein